MRTMDHAIEDGVGHGRIAQVVMPAVARQLTCNDRGPRAINTGAPADEAAQITVGDLELGHVAGNGYSSVKIRGKGNKVRRCPLWPQTATQLAALVAARAATDRVFLNRRGQTGPPP